jgi:Zn-dependent protease
LFENIPFATILVSYVAVLLALSVHEASHATAAHLLEDDTASSLGRMTLNPLAHIDLLGTVILPLVGMVTGARVIGWAKPVPVNPNRLTRRYPARVGYAMVAAAGPLSNLAQSLLFMIILTIFIRVAFPMLPPMVRARVFEASMYLPVETLLQEPSLGHGTVLALALLGRLVVINVALAIFNLLPVGPLDGAGILRGFLPYNALATFDRIQPTITIVLLGMFLLGIMDKVLRPIFAAADFIYIMPVSRLLLGA